MITGRMSAFPAPPSAATPAKPPEEKSGPAAAERPVPKPAPSGVGLSAVRKTFAEARHLRRMAGLVHERRVAGSIESAPLLHRSLTLACHGLIELQGETPPGDFRALIERATAIAGELSLSPAPTWDDAALLDEMTHRFADPESVTSAPDGRRYDRTFQRLGPVQDAFQDYATERLGSDESGLRAQWKAILAVGLAFAVVGFLIGTRVSPQSATAPAAAAPRVIAPGAGVGAAPLSVGFRGTVYRDVTLTSAAVTRTDSNLNFDWGSGGPEGLDRGDQWGAVWMANLHVEQPGKYQFFLTSDDGSRLLIDGTVVVDNWGGHSEYMKFGQMDLTAGNHPIRVEYFDSVGKAMLKLEWQLPNGERRLVDAQDLQ
jgi:hypothetical protein